MVANLEVQNMVQGDYQGVPTNQSRVFSGEKQTGNLREMFEQTKIEYVNSSQSKDYLNMGSGLEELSI